MKFLTFKDKDGKPIKRYQYTAIEDAIRVRAVKIYERHNQANAISFIEYDLMTDSNTSNWAFSQLISHPALIRTDFLSKLMGDLIPVAEHLRVC